MTYEISSGFVLINPNTNKILILKLSKKFEWDLPKGHQEVGETLIETAYREIWEEVQINKSQINILKNFENEPINSFFEYKSPISGNIRKIYLFLGLTSQDIILSNEHCGFAWCNLEESLEYLKFKDIQNCVKKLYSKYTFNNNK